MHHAVFSALNPIFEPTFIAHSFSCRKNKGTHKAVAALERMLWKASANHTLTCYVLKCDVHKFFASVDHEILLRAIATQIGDERTLALLREIVHSFHSQSGNRKGIPIGNLTSQLFANVYMNAFDQFMKHALHIKNYIRYTDDFVIVAETNDELVALIPLIERFLHVSLLLYLHPHKMSIRKYRQGIDFLGYVVLPHHRALRTKTKRRMFRKLHEKSLAISAHSLPREAGEQSLQSYLGVLSHADCYRLSRDVRNQHWFLHS